MTSSSSRSEFSYAKLAIGGKWGRAAWEGQQCLEGMDGRTERGKCKVSPVGGGQAGRQKAIGERRPLVFTGRTGVILVREMTEA